ncbi:hypothetical protein [Solibacillus cecembensis]|uniref:hypothetical protein n=1 Tax=Solibacillus cecembensis TaxID=459347 RepID=UPI003AA78A94
MNAFLIYVTPVVAFIFFLNFIGILRDVKDGEKETTVQVLLGSFMFAFLVFALVLAGISNTIKTVERFPQFLLC